MKMDTENGLLLLIIAVTARSLLRLTFSITLSLAGGSDEKSGRAFTNTGERWSMQPVRQTNATACRSCRGL